ncbi:MAG: baseplate J/gp47 family protein [Kofleriaceae bacterium]
MGFYHDRFLTESKLGSAQLIDDLGKIVALIGYRPLPAVAATAFQWFEALAAGIVTSGTRVSGKIATPPATVIYETSATIDVAPECNRMALSPLITRSPGALRAIVAPILGALPTDDFRPQTRALISDGHGVELSPIAGSRSRGVAFGRALSRSFEPTAQVSRATVLRRLRGPRTLASDLVAFEVSTTPILHLPSLAAPELLVSTLEIFALRPQDEPIDPSEWPLALRYEEKVDFSASEAGDLHYRTFVDDQLHTWIILRTALGARTLLDDGQLTRIYARFVPAVGSMLGPQPTHVPNTIEPLPIPPITDVTLGLDASYFTSSLVVPPLVNQPLEISATWAMVDRDLGLATDDSILIQDASGTRWIRTLIARAPGASPRLLRWASDAPGAPADHAPLPEAHDPVVGVLDAASVKIGSLTDAANGDAFPTWRELYAQLSPPGGLERVTDPGELPLAPINPTGSLARRRIVAAGTTHLVVGDASHIAVGDFVLLGQRLTRTARTPALLGPWRTNDGEPLFDPRTPWLDAEIVQAVEVRGNVVRLATPVSQDYFIHEGTPIRDATPAPLSEVIALPGVVSVASGDQLRQTVSLATVPSFAGNDTLLYDASYTRAKLARTYTAAELRQAFGLDGPASKPTTGLKPVIAAKPTVAKPARATAGKQAIEPPPPPPTPAAAWATLFVAVAGVAEAQPDVAWSFDVIVRAANLRPRFADVVRLEDTAGHALTDDLIALPDETALALRSAAAAASVAAQDVVAVLHEPLIWHRVADPAAEPGADPGAADELVVRELISFDVRPTPPEAGRASLFPLGGTLILRPGEPAAQRATSAERRYPFTWPADADGPHVLDVAPTIATPFEAILISQTPLAQRDSPGASLTADWSISRERFRDPAFGGRATGTLVGASASHARVVTCTFTRDGDANVALHEVPLVSNVDPLLGCADVWAVWPGELPAGSSVISADWSYPLAPDDPGALPASAAIRFAVGGARALIVDAHTAADGRSATIDAARSATAGDLGFALEALYGLEATPLGPAQIAASEIWAWQGIAPALADLPAPSHSQIVAVIPAHDRHGLDTITWPREAVWWDAERRTLRLPTALRARRPEVRPADVVRLLQILTPAIDHRRLAIQHDPITDRSIVTMAVAPGWPDADLTPAPVVIATRAHGHGLEVVETTAPIDVFTTADGHVRWTLVFAGDVRDRWTDLSMALRDWSAPGERGLTVTPLWRVPGSQATRARAAAGAMTLIATTCDAAGFRALAAMPRVADDGAIELAPIGPGRVFPDPAELAQLSLAIYERIASAAAPLHLVGTTLLEVPPIADPPPPVTHVVFVDGDAWRPIRVVRATAKPDGSQRYELAAADLLGVLPREPPVQLCYARSELVTTLALPTLQTLRLRLDHPGTDGVDATALAFLIPGDPDFVLLEATSPATRDGDALVLELDGLERDRLFAPDGTPQWTALHVALRWLNATLAAAALRVALGDVPYELLDGDVLEIGFADGHTVTSVVHAASDGGRTLQLMPATPVVIMPDRLTLRRLRTTIAPEDYIAHLALTPTTPQPPWLLSFACDRNPSSLRDTLLPYASTWTYDGQQRFQFEHDPAVAEIFRQVALPGTTLFLFGNERSELRGELYTEVDDHLKLDLDSAPLNFLTDPDATAIGELVLTSTAWAVQALGASRPILLTAIQGAASAPRLELAITGATPGRVATNTVVQSTRFNTGNFIPLAGQGGVSNNPAALIANALRISARPAPRADANHPAWQPVKYLSPDELSTLVAALPTGTMASLAGMTYRDALNAKVVSTSGEPLYRFSASFSSSGVCTLHFLFVDDALLDLAQVRIETQYAVGRGRINPSGSSLYPLETPVVVFDPARQLALLAPNQLKPHALVFVRQPETQDVPAPPALQWTRVSRVIGPIVEIDPPIQYVAGAPEPVAVTALGRLEHAAQLDADYYAAVAKAKLVPGDDGPTSWLLPLHDRLPLDILVRPDNATTTAPQDAAVTPSLLAALIPGDLVLVFDERQRQAWGTRRQGLPQGTWQTWPDVQHEAVVKAVDAETGMLVLAAPLPDSVQLRWTLDRTTGRLAPDAADLAALRVLPHYRAPVQGPHTLAVLGSGNRTHRFARYLSALEAGTGSAVIPIAADGVTVGNLEVVAFDPEKATWSRWMRFDKLSRAGKKDPAFTLGFRPSGLNGKVPVSVTFGDGITGQLLPTGTRNVYLRSTRIGTPASAAPSEVWIVSSDPVSPADPVPPSSTRKLRLAYSAPDELIGGSGAAQWRPALQITVPVADGPLALFEIRPSDAAAGAHGFVLVTDLDMPPGVVDAYLYTRDAVPAGSEVTASQRAGSHPWTLDRAFYDNASNRELTVIPGAVSIQLLATTGLRAGSLLALYPDDASLPDIVHLASIDPPTWSAVVTSPLPRAYDLERSFLRGNIAPIVQGAVDRVTLGSSDGTTPSQRLPLQNREPLLYVDKPGKEPAPDVTVFVSGQPWERVLDFTSEAPAKRGWRLDHEPDGTSFIVFGDGKHGAIPPAGRDSIEVRMRLGTGAAGNLPTGAINKLVSGNLAVKSTANLRPASGGSAGDLPAQAREKAFAHKLPSDRVVSAGDCVRAALGISGVTSAALDPAARPGTLRLVVAMDDRRVPTDDDLRAIREQIADEMPATAHVRLDVVPAEQSAVHLVIELGVDPAQPAGDVFAAVTAAFAADGIGFFAPDRWDIGEPLRLGTIYEALQAVPGVATARVVWMAATPLLDGELPSGPAPDAFDPGATGVVRCDNDRLLDPFGRAGTFRLEPAPEATS